MSSVGVGAHISAAASGGPRYDATLTPLERRSAANGIWLCNSCGRLVDNDASTFTVGELAQWKLDAIERARKALASGGRSTTEGLFAEQIELQKHALAHHREAHAQLLREQKLARFAATYARFLEESKAYARAISSYSENMLLTEYRLDRSTRAALQRPIGKAIDSLTRALQPILLTDSDDTRRTLRWEILRRRGLEPVIDTVENQKAYAHIIHYHHIRLLDAITHLQENVRVSLGEPPDRRTPADNEFRAKMLADAEANAKKAKLEMKA